MNSYTARAIILRETNVGESNKILTLLAKDRGKFSCTAIGCRRTKSRLFSCSSMFCYGDFEINTINKYPQLHQASPIESFYNIRTDLDTLAYGTYIMEIIEKTTLEGVESNDAMLLLLKALQRLNAHQNPVLVCAIFKIRLLSILGYVPYLDGCINCNSQTEILTEEGLKCINCSDEKEPFIIISENISDILKFIIYGELKAVFSLAVEENIVKELSNIADFLFKQHIDLQFKTYKFINQLNNFH